MAKSYASVDVTFIVWWMVFAIMLISANVRNWGSSVVFNTSIQNDKDYILVNEKILVNDIKFDIIYDFCINVFSVNWMKRKMTRKSVYEMKGRWKFFNHYLAINWDVAMQWGLAFLKWCSSKRELIACCLGRLVTFRWYWPIILSRWKWIGMRLAIVSTFYISEVQNTSVIYKATLFCIFFNFLSGW